jgi:FMN-dependent NADH-azoreductase
VSFFETFFSLRVKIFPCFIRLPNRATIFYILVIILNKWFLGRTIMAKKILFVNACARSGSRTLRLARALEEKIGEGADIKEIKLFEISMPILDEKLIAKRDHALITDDYSDSYFDAARDFANADEIIIAAPYWDLSFPAVLKQYLEMVSINGITFKYTPEGMPIGLCHAKKLYYVTTSGGEIGDLNLGYDYVKALTTLLFGVERTYCVRAVGLDIFGVDAEAVLENAIQNLGLLK